MSILDTITQSVGSAFGGLFGKTSGQSVIGIDIGSSSVKIVQLRRENGKAILETYGALALGPYGGEKIGNVVRLQQEKLVEALTDLLKEGNITATRAGVAVPYTTSITSIITLPYMSQEQVSRTVPLEARKYIPVPMNEVTLDWYVIPKDDSQFGDAVDRKAPIEVLIIAIQNETLQYIQRVLDSAGLTPLFYELEVFSAARSSLGHGIAPVMLLDIGAATTKVSIVERGIIRASHTANRGGQEMTLAVARALNLDFEAAEKAKRDVGLMPNPSTEQTALIRTALLSTLGHIFSEAHKVLLEYGKRYQKTVGHILLTGGGATLKDIIPYAKERLSVSDVSLAYPFEKVENPAFLNDILKEVGPEFAVAVGAALRALNGE
jgi:type IV pilus assembly protein PilM